MIRLTLDLRHVDTGEPHSGLADPVLSPASTATLGSCSGALSSRAIVPSSCSCQRRAWLWRLDLDALVREGALRMLLAALRAEVDEYVAQHANERDVVGRAVVVRNGVAQPRKGDHGCWRTGGPGAASSRSA